MRELSFALVTAATLSICLARGWAQDSLAPDLQLDYSCSGAPPAEEAIESFLRARGFEVANAERMRRQLGAGFFSMDIEAMDRRQWQVEFRGLRVDPRFPGNTNVSYYVSVFSPPPTVHDSPLEDALVKFVAATPGCQITRTMRTENPANAAATFSYTVELYHSRMHEVAVCDRTEPTYDEKACDAVPGVKLLKSQHP
jgi:hypothetical protein